MRPSRAVFALCVLVASCATARQYLALRQVTFNIDRVQGVRLAGVLLDHVRQPSDISPFDYARITAAVLRHQVPLELELHVMGQNPADNNTKARLARFQWTLSLNGHETVSGVLDTVYTFPAGVRTDVRIPIQFDLAQFFNENANDALDLALGLAGLSSRQTDIELRAIPTIDTPLGPIQYPNAITVRRTVGPAGP
jgi:hypothetical protein